MIVDRILEIILLNKINKSQFYKKTGLSNGFLDKVKDIGASKIEDILNSFPEINPEWLLTGKGEMLKQPEGSAKVSPDPKDQYIIDLQKKHIAKLEEELAELKKAQQNPKGYGMVAESKSKLKDK